MANDRMRSHQRDQQFAEIIHALNDLDRIRGGLFDCDHLGYCRVWWYGVWQCEWFDKIETLRELDKKLKGGDAAGGETGSAPNELL